VKCVGPHTYFDKSISGHSLLSNEIVCILVLPILIVKPTITKEINCFSLLFIPIEVVILCQWLTALMLERFSLKCYQFKQ